MVENSFWIQSDFYAPSSGFQILYLGVLFMRSREEGPTDWSGLFHINEGAAPVCHGEEGAELNLLVHLRSSTHLWSGSLDLERK